MPRTRSWNALDGKLTALLFVVAVLMFLPGLGATGIVNSSDGYYTEGAREMLERKDLLTPFLNYQPFYEKPILTYWLIIFFYKLLGVSTFAARLPSALCAIASVPLLYVATRHFLNRRAAFLAAVALLATPLFAVVGHVALTDMPLMFLTTSANLLLLCVLNGATAWLLPPAYAALGLAVLCKGPIALFVVAATIGGYLLLTSKSFTTLFGRVKRLHPIVGVLILLAVALPWYLIEHSATRGEFTRVFFIEQNLGRASGTLQSHISPWWFYIPYIFGAFFPWTILLLQSPSLFRLKRKRFSDNRRSNLLLAATCWALITAAALTIAPSKLPTYLLPIAPAVAILTGCYIDSVIRTGWRRLVIWTAPVMVIGSALSFIFIPRLFHGSSGIRALVIVFVSLMIASIVGYGICLWRSKIRAGFVVLTASCYLACAILVPLGILHIYKHGPAQIHKLLRTAAANDSSVAIVAKESRPAAFYLKKPIYEVNTHEDLATFLDTTKKPHAIIVGKRHLGDVVKWLKDSAQIVEQKGDYFLVSAVE